MAFLEAAREGSYVLGANGATLHTVKNLSKDPVQQALCALFAGIVDKTPEDQLYSFFTDVFKAIEEHGERGERGENYLSVLVVACFHVRDIRTNGKGRRRQFYALFECIAREFPDKARRLLELVPLYGSWKDMVELYRRIPSLQTDVVEIWGNALKDDGNVLAFKWAPRLKKAVNRETGLGNKLKNYLFPNQQNSRKRYRKHLARASLRFPMTETLMCRGEWPEIDIPKVSSVCFQKHKKAFLRHIPEKVRDAAKKGKIHAGVVSIHDLAMNVYMAYRSGGSLSMDEVDVINAQANDILKGFKNVKGLPVIDTSGSMANGDGQAMAAAIGIGWLIATLNEKIFITFSDFPQIIELRYPLTKLKFDAILQGGSRNTIYGHPLGEWNETRAGSDLTFCESVLLMYTSAWGGSTDFIRTHDLILSLAKKKGGELPSTLYVLSDMDFNAAVGKGTQGEYMHINITGGITPYANCAGKHVTNPWQPQHEAIEEAYCKNGFEMPNTVYWNLRGTPTKGFVARADCPGVQMMAGNGQQQLKLLCGEDEEKKNTYDLLLKAVNHPVYDPIRAVMETKVETKEETKEETVEEPKTEPKEALSLFDRLRTSESLLRAQLITQEEYDEVKKAVLSSLVGP